MPRLACIALFSASVVSLAAQQFPDGAGLIQRSSEALRNYGSLEYSMDMSTALANSAMPVNFTINMVFRSKGNKFRIDANAAALGPVLEAVMDGQDTWMYMPSLKQYSKVPAADSAMTQKILGSLTGAASVDDSKMNSGAKVVRSEVIDVDGQSHDCWVTESHMADLGNAETPP